MDFGDILAILVGIISAAVTVFNFYIKFKEEIRKKAGEYIDTAEGMYECGEEKMKTVIKNLSAIIPKVFKPFFTKPKLEQTIQTIFDYMESYAKKQIEKKTDNIN